MPLMWVRSMPWEAETPVPISQNKMSTIENIHQVLAALRIVTGHETTLHLAEI